MLIQTILADLRATTDERRRRESAAREWARVIGKAFLSPSSHCAVLFRISSALYQYRLLRPLAFAVRTMSVVWGGTEIHPAAQIGPGLCLVHSQKILIGEGVVIGAHARICHGVSIGGDLGRGMEGKQSDWPRFGDNVTIGMDAIIMGPVTVGDGAVIGAQALVIKDVPPHAIVSGSPATIRRYTDAAERGIDVAGVSAESDGAVG